MNKPTTPVSKATVLEASENRHLSISKSMSDARDRVINYIMSPKMRNLWRGTSREVAESLADADFISDSGDSTVFDYRLWRHMKSGQQQSIEAIILRAKNTTEDVVHLTDEELKLISAPPTSLAAESIL